MEKKLAGVIFMIILFEIQQKLQDSLQATPLSFIIQKYNKKL
jgi:hypothetical protein